jgi:hypothetical protein
MNELKHDVKSRLDFMCKRSPNAPTQTEEKVSRRKALEKGYKMYWNGTPCEHGHVSVRYSFSGRCRECYRLWRAEEILYSEISKDPLKTRKTKKKEEK